jgi:outer membrane protein
VQEEVWSCWSRLLEAQEATGPAEALVEEAAEGLRLTRERYEAGADTVTDLLDAQTALARAEAELVGARWDYRAAQSRYRRSTGDLVVSKQP